MGRPSLGLALTAPFNMPHTEPSSSPASPRLYGLDALRALAMFLGVVLHAALSFLTFEVPYTPAWDESRAGLLDIAVFAIHAFRMQAFFVVAGYFAALGLAKRPVREFFAGRALRIGLPLLVGAFTIVPLTIAPFLIAQNASLKPVYLVATPAHLWFLVYLVIFSLGAAAWHLTTEKHRLGTGGRGGWLARAATSPWAVLWLIVPTVLLNLTMPTWIIETAWGWIPNPASLAYYTLFFATGYALHRSGTIESVGRAWPVFLPIAIFVLLPALVVIGAGFTPVWVTSLAGRPVLAHLANAPAAVIQAAFTWSMVLGLLGVLNRACRVSRPWVRWLADASYWVYLSHLPVVYFLQLKLVAWQVPGVPVGPLAALLKFAIILATTIAFCLITYAIFVRPTPLERIIGGGRAKPRAASG